MTITTPRAPIEDWLTVQQFADRIGVSYATAYQWFADDAREAWRAGLDTDWCCKPYDKKNWRIDPAWAAAFVPPSQRSRTSKPLRDNHPLAAWLTLRQVADRFGVAYATATKWWRSGALVSGTWRDDHHRLIFAPDLIDALVPLSQRPRAAIAAAGRLTAHEAAAFVGCSVPHLNRAVKLGDLPFVLIDGTRAFHRADLEAWQTMPTPTGRPRVPRSLESARAKAVRSGPLLSLSDAWRLLGYADRSGVTRLVERGRLPIVLDEAGRRWVKRTDVEALVAERQARREKREARAAA
ncbi:helix-turn-helix domain-containing protein [Burkholderia cepacia]|uniref:helix-turn-helix domain-containing protein n=1 Tax=Burkholderia cepacia TaxID=292 RepID=UPI00264BE3B7|nr:helix-turn-helix domain-containing protein [Burkholderia cepacia]MDN7857989.1 helix-turn-helix domain-containing protein [Burkholderia cepacia]